MTALAQGVQRPQCSDVTRGTAPQKGSTIIYQGALVMLDTSGYARPAAASVSGAYCVGVAWPRGRDLDRYDSTVTGYTADGSLSIEFEQGIFGFQNDGSNPVLATTQPGTVLYAVDDQTVSLSSGGSTRPVAGRLVRLDSTSIGGPVLMEVSIALGTLLNTLITVTDASAAHLAGTETFTGVKTFGSGADPVFAKEADHTVNVVASTTAATVGGALTVAAGAGQTSGNGGAASLTGGAGGATGAGGAANVTGGAGGATSGTGGAAAVAGGVGTAGNSAGGAASLTGGAGQGSAAGGAASTVGGAGGATGTGGAAALTGGAGGATSGTGGAAAVAGGAGTAGNSAGGVASVTGGAGQGSAAGGIGKTVGGAGGATGAGGAAQLTGGAGGATSGTGGAVAIAGGAGSGGNANGGAVTIDGGAKNGSGADGAITIGGTRGVVNIGKSGGSIGFFGATAVAQQSTTGTTTGFTAGSGTGAKSDSTYTGNSGSTAYTVGDVVLALKNLGFLAA